MTISPLSSHTLRLRFASSAASGSAISFLSSLACEMKASYSACDGSGSGAFWKRACNSSVPISMSTRDLQHARPSTTATSSARRLAASRRSCEKVETFGTNGTSKRKYGVASQLLDAAQERAAVYHSPRGELFRKSSAAIAESDDGSFLRSRLNLQIQRFDFSVRFPRRGLALMVDHLSRSPESDRIVSGGWISVGSASGTFQRHSYYLTWDVCFGVGGPDRDRTGDLMNAIHARSQLRYWPTLQRSAARDEPIW